MERVKGYLQLEVKRLKPFWTAYHEYVEENEKGELVAINFLGELKRINIFVGANNSGKSRLMRKLFAYRKGYYLFPIKNTWRNFKEVLRIRVEQIKNMVDTEPFKYYEKRQLDLTDEVQKEIEKVPETNRSDIDKVIKKAIGPISLESIKIDTEDSTKYLSIFSLH